MPFWWLLRRFGLGWYFRDCSQVLPLLSRFSTARTKNEILALSGASFLAAATAVANSLPFSTGCNLLSFDLTMIKKECKKSRFQYIILPVTGSGRASTLFLFRRDPFCPFFTVHRRRRFIRGGQSSAIGLIFATFIAILLV